MTKMRFWALGALVLSVMVAVGGQQDGVVFRHKLGPSAKDSYDFTFKSNQSMQMDGGPAGAQDMPIDISAKMKLALDYGAFDEKAGKADLKMNFTNIEWDMGQAGGMMGGGPEPPKEMAASGKIDNRNRITDFKTPDMGMRGMMMGMGSGGGNPFASLFLEFPETPVKTGESWKVEMANPMAKDKKSMLTATLTGEKEFNGLAAHIVAVKGTIDVNGDLGEMLKDSPQGQMMNGMKIMMTGKIDLTGEALVEKSTGRTLSINMVMKGAQVIDMPDMGMKMNVSGNTTLKMVLANKA